MLALLVAVAGLIVIRPWTIADGTPDDRLLAAMQFGVDAAQKALDETGSLPASVEDLDFSPRLLPGAIEEIELGYSYHRLNASSIRLCGEFDNASSGQAMAWPYFDYGVGLHEDLAAPRPRAGRHCYDVSLIATAPALRADALTFRQLNSIATAMECAFLETRRLPESISGAERLAPLERDDPACRATDRIQGVRPNVQYTPMGASSIRLCARFEGQFNSADQTMRIFDPRRDARFPELLQTEVEAGQRCYLIQMRVPDPQRVMPTSQWDEIEVELLPASIRGDARHDKDAIGDIANVLRLARCAYTLAGATSATFHEAVQTVSLRPRIAERFECGWAPSYFANNPDPSATYERIDNEHVRSCADFRRAWAQPLALNFYVEALADWPTSLPELQRPISEPGRHCFQVRLTAIGSGVI
jgi:hypothetical protein